MRFRIYFALLVLVATLGSAFPLRAQAQQKTWTLSPPWEPGAEYRYQLKEVKVKAFGPTKGQEEGYSSTAVFKILEKNEAGWLASWQEQDFQYYLAKNPGLPSSKDGNKDGNIEMRMAEATSERNRQLYMLQLDSLGYLIEIANYEEISERAQKEMDALKDAIEQAGDDKEKQLSVLRENLVNSMKYGSLLQENQLYDMLTNRLNLLMLPYDVPLSSSDTLRYEGLAKLGVIAKYDLPAEYDFYVRNYDETSNTLDIFVELFLNQELIKAELRKYAEENEEENEIMSLIYSAAAEADVRNEYLLDYTVHAERRIPLKILNKTNTYVRETNELMQTKSLSLELSE